MPWLFYDETNNERTIQSATIKTVFTKDSQLQFMAARYELDGTFTGLYNITASDLLLCQEDEGSMESAFKIGTHYYRQVNSTHTIAKYYNYSS